MGQLIALSGIDGVGKSTQVRRLTKYLQDLGYTVNSGESMFTYHLFMPLVQAIRSATGLPQAGPVRINRRLLPKLWFILAFIDIWTSYLFIIRPLLARFDYLIADRFYSDLWSNLLYYGYLPKWGFGLVRFLPRADIALLLIADPVNILKREQEFPQDYYYTQHKIYTHLGQILSLSLIDANKPPSHVYEHILTTLTS